MSTSRPRPVRVLAAVAAGATAATGGLALLPGVPAWIPGAVGLLGLVLTVAVGKYTEEQVTPLSDPRDDAGRQLRPVPPPSEPLYPFEKPPVEPR